MSELFLDTELNDRDLQRIADVLIASPYDRDEIDRIFRDEVAPAFSANLLSVAGEWQPWSQEEVQTIVEDWLKKAAKNGWLARVRSRAQLRIIPDEWPRILDLLG